MLHCDEDPAAYRYFPLLIAQRYAGDLRYISDTKLMTPEARVRAGLGELLLLRRPPVPQAGPVTVKISQVDLAAKVGVSRTMTIHSQEPEFLCVKSALL